MKILFVLTALMLSGCGIASRTMDADNVIASYEWFHDAHNQVLSKQRQISVKEETIAETTDEKELSRLRVELDGMKASCQNLVGEYNANSSKANHTIFKGRTAPITLDYSICE